MQPTDDLKKAARLGAITVAKVMRALLEGPCGIKELQAISGLSINTIHEYMRALRKEGAVHVAGWDKDSTGRESLRVYKLGAGKDAPRQRKSKAQIARECRARKKERATFAALAQSARIPLGSRYKSTHVTSGSLRRSI